MTWQENEDVFFAFVQSSMVSENNISPIGFYVKLCPVVVAAIFDFHSTTKWLIWGPYTFSQFHRTCIQLYDLEIYGQGHAYLLYSKLKYCCFLLKWIELNHVK